MELFINNSFDAAFNLALEEVMTRNHDRGFLMLWRNANAVIIGRNQNTAAEINADRVREYQCDVVRRSTGGGAVYHDLGNLNYSIAVPGKLVEHKAFADYARPVLDALKQGKIQKCRHESYLRLHEELKPLRDWQETKK